MKSIRVTLKREMVDLLEEISQASKMSKSAIIEACITNMFVDAELEKIQKPEILKNIKS